MSSVETSLEAAVGSHLLWPVYC